MMTYHVFSDGGELLSELDDSDACSGNRTGGIGEMCGGCDGCLLMQAQCSGFRIEEQPDNA